MTRIAIINKTAPYATSAGQESLDLALAAANFGQDVSLFFIEDGVYQLLNQQAPEHIDQRNYSKTFAALEFYDIENIYVCAKSLHERGLSEQDLCIDVQQLDFAAITENLNHHQHCLSF